MTYIIKDGKVYKQYEEEVDLAKEEYTLQAWKDALVSDARELSEYEQKIAEIEAVQVSKETKDSLKQNINFTSGSGISQELVDIQQAKVDEIKSLLNGD